MIPLNKIVNRNFVLVYSDQRAAQAIEAVRRLQPLEVIVRRWDGGTVYHYLFSAQEFQDRLAHAGSEELLITALDLHEWSATPALDSGHDAEFAPPRYVITDRDQVIGFYDVQLPPAVANSMRGDNKDVGPAGPPVSRSLRTEFPETIAQEQTASLLAWMTRELGQSRALPLAAPVGAQLDIVVQAQQGFVLEGTGEGHLSITDEEETLPIQFRLRATEVGPGRIRVLSFQGGQALGAITLTPMVVAANEQVDGQRSAESKRLPLLTVAQPDLTLMIEEQTAQGQTQISLRLWAVDPTLGLNFKQFGPIKLRDPQQYFQAFFEDIEGLTVRTAEEQAIAVRKLALKGAGLFQELPEDLRVLVWSLRDRIRTVQVLSDDPWIPWELLKLQGKEGNRVVEGPFLCEAFAMTRWFPGIGRKPELTLDHMAIVVPTNSGLSYAGEERTYLRSLANTRREVTEVPATYLDVLEALSQGEHDGWHFTGHGQFSASDPNRSAISLEDQQLCAGEITGTVSNCGLKQPFVFLNACQTGREALSLTGIGGWARRFAEAGAAGFIGSLWSVYDEAACTFAKSVYGQLLAGEPIGEAVKAARASIKPLNDPSWLAYTVFADPLATVK